MRWGAAVLLVLTLLSKVSIGLTAQEDGVFRMKLDRRVRRVQPHEVDARHRRNRRLTLDEDTPAEEVPIMGPFKDLAYFYTDVFVGTPPQRFSVITDTGSTLLAFPCKNCGNCGAHMNPKFDVDASSTVQEVGCGAGVCHGRCTNHQCGYTQSYAEGSSLVGVYYNDLVFLGGSEATAEEKNLAVHYQFGCHSSETNMFVTQAADGIMGMSQASTSLLSTLQSQGKLQHHMFSMCLTLNGGELVIGGVDTSMHQSAMVFAALTATQSFYTVTVKGAKFDGKTLVTGSAITAFNGGRHTIVDSGTTFTYVPSSTFSALQAKVRTYCSAAQHCKGTTTHVAGESMCYRLSKPADLATFPSMSLVLAGSGGADATITLPPEALFVSMAWDNGAYCLGVYSNGARGGVIGANAMLNHDVLFDLEARRVGFAPSACTPGQHPEQPIEATQTATATATATATVTTSATVSVTATGTTTMSTTVTPTVSMSVSASVSVSESAPPAASPSPSSSVAAAVTTVDHGEQPDTPESPTSQMPSPLPSLSSAPAAAASASPSPSAATPSSSGAPSPLPSTSPVASVVVDTDAAAAPSGSGPGSDRPDVGTEADLLVGVVVGLGAFVLVVVGLVVYVALRRDPVSFGPLSLSSVRSTRGFEPVGARSNVGMAEDDRDDGLGLDDDLDDDLDTV